MLVAQMKILKEKQDSFEHSIFIYCDWWFNNIIAPLYEIGNDEKQQFYVYERYMHTLARNEVVKGEHNEDVTTNDFVEEVCKKEMEFMKDFEQKVLLKKKTDEEKVKEECEAMAQELEENMPIGSSDEGKES